MKRTTAWTVAAVTLALSAAALALAIVALVAGDGEARPLPAHRHELPQHEHQLPHHEHALAADDNGGGWEWLHWLLAFDTGWGWQPYGEDVAEDWAEEEPWPSPTPAERDYLFDVCLPLASFWEALLASGVADVIEGDDPAGVADVFLEPLRALSADLAAVTPPETLTAHHDAMLTHLEEAVGLFEAIAAGAVLDEYLHARYEALSDPFRALPPELKDYPAEANSEVVECEGLEDFLAGFLGIGAD